MSRGFFITGTDTGVGKTYVGAGLIRAFSAMGYTVCPMKPVETGCTVRDGRLIPGDTRQLILASGVNEPVERINPYRFRHPLAPSVAAELEGVIIQKQKILSAYRNLSKRYDITIVEGAGGIMVPVYKRYLFLDLVKDLGLPLVIVSRPGLGTINHTLLTIEAAKRHGLTVLGVIINHAEKTKKGLTEKTNPDVIRRLGKAPILGTIPHSKNRTGPPLKHNFMDTAGNIMDHL